MEKQFKDCYFRQEGDVIVLGNSRIERAWTIQTKDLSTIRFLDKRTGRDWAKGQSPESAMTTQDGLMFLDIVESVTAEIVESSISEPCLQVRFKGPQWAKCFELFPETPAIRAWLELLLDWDFDLSNLGYTQVEALSLDLKDAKVTAVELHDLTDATNHLATVGKAGPLGRLVGNHVFIETPNGEGVFAYKESPVPNSQLYPVYYDFQATEYGIACIGAGFHNLPVGETRRTYAFTIGVYSGGLDGGILALKEYQAARYKLVPERDYIIAANSWGDFHTDINEAVILGEIEGRRRQRGDLQRQDSQDEVDHYRGSSSETAPFAPLPI